MDDENAEGAIRAADLTGTIGAHDLDLGAELKATARRDRGRGKPNSGPSARSSRRRSPASRPSRTCCSKLRAASTAYDKVQALVVDLRRSTAPTSRPAPRCARSTGSSCSPTTSASSARASAHMGDRHARAH